MREQLTTTKTPSPYGRARRREAVGVDATLSPRQIAVREFHLAQAQRHPRLTPAAVEAFELLAMRACPRTLVARLPLIDLATSMDCTIPVMEAAVRELAKAGHVRRVTRGRCRPHDVHAFALSGEERP